MSKLTQRISTFLSVISESNSTLFFGRSLAMLRRCLSKNDHIDKKRLSFQSWSPSFGKRVISLFLCLTLASNQILAMPQVPQTIGMIVAQWHQDLRFRYYSGGWGGRFLAFFQGKLDDRPTKPKEKKQEKQEDRDAEVARLQLFPTGNITLQTAEPITFNALALTSDNAPVSGVKLKWSVEDVSADKEKRKGKPVITDRGVFFSPIAGDYLITVSGAKFQANTRVTVKGNPQPPLNKLIEKYKPFSYGTLSTRDVPEGKPVEQQKIGSTQPTRKATALVAQSKEPQPALRSKNLLNQATSLRAAPGMMTVASIPAFQSGDPCGWNNSNWTTADDSGKERGDMPGRAADGGAGSGNYEFTAPVIGLDSRGLDLQLALTYNSRLWHKANSDITFDIDRDWPAPGWNIGFGRIVSMGTDRGFMLIDGDGTRHGYTGNALAPSGWQYFTGKTIDGTFTDYGVWADNGIPSSGWAKLANGTTIYYGTSNSTTRAIYPTQITDAQGNYITITYVSNQGPNIATITDTMGRSIVFNYTNGLLTDITAPGLTTNSTRTLVRLQYKSHTLSYNFSLTPHVCSSAVNVLEAIYYPATNTGYWFGDTDSYSGYGMITKIQECRNMTYSTSNGISKHSDPFNISREIIYEYQTSGTLSAEPTYTKMKEKWVAMDTTAPGIVQSGTDAGYAVTTFAITTEPEGRRTTITRPDGTNQVQYAHISPGYFNDGLVFYAKTCAAGQPCAYNDMGLRASSISWQQGDYSSPRPGFIHHYDLPNNPYTTKLTTFSYGSYNQVTELQEWGYDGLPKRKTITTYENGAGYINRHIFKLVKSVEARDANNVALSRIEYNYDETALANTTPATVPVTHHDSTYDPYNTQQNCYPVYDWEGNYLYDDCYPVFDSTTNYRGNVTSIKRYPTPNSSVGLITETRGYDKTGNLITATTGCCEKISFTYTQSTQFAYSESQWRGSSTDPNLRITTDATWNYNTGLVAQTKDANQLTTIYEYYPSTLRPQYIWSPTGAYTHHVYDDGGLAVYDRVFFNDDLISGNPFTLAVGKDKYLDGLGRVQGEIAFGAYVNGQYELDIVQTKYDGLGRLWKQTRPFRYGTPANQVAWSEASYDALDRVTQTTEPDNSTTKRFYDEVARPSVASSDYGNTIRIQDQWGRERWARTDWDGKLVEVVEPEPNATTNFGLVLSGTGYKTTYEYDVLGNLTKTLQGDQTREFKYDGLNRMVAQKLAERTATLDDAGNAGSSWSDVFKYDDRSNLIERTDARQVSAIFTYNNDPLNRLQSVSYQTGSANTSPVHAAPTTTYTYETGANLDKTRLKTVTVAGIVTDNLAYDGYGRINEVTRTFNDNTARPLLTNYLYDKADRVREITYPEQWGTSTVRKIAKMNYDTASRYNEMLFGGQSFASAVSYNAESQATALKIGYNTGANEIKELYTYNPQNGLLTNQIVQKNPGAPTNLLDLSYDFAKVGGGTGVTGQLTKITNNLDSAKNRFYEYDALARLKTAKGGSVGTDWQQNYIYDRYGNRMSVTKTGNAPLDAVNPGGTATAFNLLFTNGQGQTVNNRITTSGYQYDNAGNLTRGQDPDGNWQQYEYDAANRLKVVKTDAGGTLANYTYGASNQRLKSVDNSVTNTWYVWEGGKVIAEYGTVSGENVMWQKSYIYLGERLLATESTSLALQFHHPDRLGSRLVTNASNGSSAGEQESLPFGTALGAGIAGNQRRFTSYDRSTMTKLDYAVNRTYNAGLGRFTQVDPIEMSASTLSDPQSLNLYAYCGNDPINHVDPDGLFFKKLFNWIKKIVGWVIKVVRAIVFTVAAVLLIASGNVILGIRVGLEAAAQWADIVGASRLAHGLRAAGDLMGLFIAPPTNPRAWFNRIRDLAEHISEAAGAKKVTAFIKLTRLAEGLYNSIRSIYQAATRQVFNSIGIPGVGKAIIIQPNTPFSGGYGRFIARGLAVIGLIRKSPDIASLILRGYTLYRLVDGAVGQVKGIKAQGKVIVTKPAQPQSSGQSGTVQVNNQGESSSIIIEFQPMPFQNFAFGGG